MQNRIRMMVWVERSNNLCSESFNIISSLYGEEGVIPLRRLWNDLPLELQLSDSTPHIPQETEKSPLRINIYYTLHRLSNFLH